ncbi:hypothetical protein HUS23_08320 [Ectothiorhodospiraceae bacterium 2226]|nr:hypothetical protein HUS23_08320 [Ectothiorhodospiraceae bacterium 2226]
MSVPLSRPLSAAAAALLAATVAAPAAWADATAVFATPEGEVTIEYRDDDHVRMRAGDDAFFVIREGKAYMVGREGSRWHVVAMDDMAAWVGAAGGGGKRDGAGVDTEVRLRDTGRRETVAGIPGQVYTYAERDARTGQWAAEEEIVLSDHADARAAYRGLVRITEVLGAMAGEQGLDKGPGDVPELADKAVLRYGAQWRLTSLNRDRIPDRHFTLPAEPMAMPGARAPAAQPPSAPEGGHWATEEARDIGREAADEARSETRRGVSEGVREGVRDGVRGLFGR